MMRKKLVLADEDEQYLKELRYEFMEKAPQLDLITFTQREKLCQYFEQGGVADILVVDEVFAKERLVGQPLAVTRIALSSSMAPIEEFEVVKKYQRMDVLLDAILLKYAQDSGTLDPVRGDSNTKMAAFYSPAGGAGKTTLALSLAAAGARAGVRTLYLNLEEIDSVSDILGQTPGSLSDIFLALKTKGMQVGIKLKESIGREASAGFYYVSGVESISEYEEIDRGDIKGLVEAIRQLSSYDLVILDQASGFTGKTKQILEEADVIFMPVTADEGNVSKLHRFLEESNLHGGYDSLFGKMKLIINKTEAGQGGREWILNSVGNRIPYCADIVRSPIFTRRVDILRSGNTLLPLMTPVLQAAMAEGSEARR